jgi:hypothetical protein
MKRATYEALLKSLQKLEKAIAKAGVASVRGNPALTDGSGGPRASPSSFASSFRLGCAGARRSGRSGQPGRGRSSGRQTFTPLHGHLRRARIVSPAASISNARAVAFDALRHLRRPRRAKAHVHTRSSSRVLHGLGGEHLAHLLAGLVHLDRGAPSAPSSDTRFRATFRDMAATMPVSQIDSVLRALEEAPEGEPLTPEQEAECAARAADVAAGRVRLIPHAEVQAKLRALREAQGG